MSHHFLMWVRLQIPTYKVDLFGTFSKIDPKIRKISKFQTVVEIALVNGFRWNLWQMEALGSIFQDFLEFWIFINFSMFSTYLNIGQIRIFGNYRKYQKLMVFGYKNVKFGWKCSKNVFATFFSVTSSRFCTDRFFITTIVQKLCIYL